jgi:hypothetical protein
MSLNHSVSVVIPSFNRPQLTLRAVKSVLAQTWTNLEMSPWKRNQALSDFMFLDCGNIHTSTWLASRSLLHQCKQGWLVGNQAPESHPSLPPEFPSELVG